MLRHLWLEALLSLLVDLVAVAALVLAHLIASWLLLLRCLVFDHLGEIALLTEVLLHLLWLLVHVLCSLLHLSLLLLLLQFLVHLGRAVRHRTVAVGHVEVLTVCEEACGKHVRLLHIWLLELPLISWLLRRLDP